jgi:thiol-disulfide isomerase/thioredoxin
VTGLGRGLGRRWSGKVLMVRSFPEILRAVLRAKLRAAPRMALRVMTVGVMTAAAIAWPSVASWPGDGGEQPNALEVSQALAQGDAFMAAKAYDKALDAYHRADKLSRHTCAICLLRIVNIERRAGDLDGALETAKKAIAAAGTNKVLAAQSHLVRGTLLGTMAHKPNDKKLKEAEEEFRAALALDPVQSIGHLDLGVALLRQERDAEGIAELNLYIAAPGNSARTVREARAMVANPIRAREPFAPDFAFTSLEGGQVSNATLRGKVVLLDFWATWCPPCRESVPTIQGLHKKYADKAFEIVGVSADDDEDTLKTFVERNRMNWTEYLDASGSVGGSFDVESYPTYIVMDKEGVVRYRQSGFGPTVGSELEDTINKALKKPYMATASNAPTVSAAAPAATAAAVIVPTAAAPAKVTTVTVAAPPNVGQSASGAGAPAVAKSDAAPVYHNGALGFSYPYPKGWTVASAEMLSSANASIKQTNSAAKGNDPGQAPMSMAARLPEVIFYAYGGDGKNAASFHAVPSVRITSLESFGAMLTPEVMKSNAGALEKKGAKVISGPAKFAIGDQSLYRMDLEDTHEGQTWVSVIQTVAYDHVLTIEVLAGSPAQLELLVSTVKYSVFADADKK